MQVLNLYTCIAFKTKIIKLNQFDNSKFKLCNNKHNNIHSNLNNNLTNCETF